MASSFIAALYLLTSVAVVPEVTVIYPRAARGDSLARIDKVDSNFVFGSVQPPDAAFSISGLPVQLEDNGAFLAYLPVDWVSRAYRLTAVHSEDEYTGFLFFDTHPPVEPQPNPDLTFPRLIELTGGALRTDPRGAYYIFPDSGTVTLSDGWRSGHYRIPLTPDRTVWAKPDRVRDLGTTGAVNDVVAWRADVISRDKWVEIRLPLSRKVLYRFCETADNRHIALELYGVVSHIDMVSYAPEIFPIEEIRWEQPADHVLRLEIQLVHSIWGYKVDWDEGDMVLKIRKPPRLDRRVKGLVIAIDPGHGGDDFGAVGPTGLKEKDVNLTAALDLAEYLSKKGVRVILTRIDDFAIGLQERIRIAEDAEADLMVSIHHNALPDGVNPFDEFGTGTYYYQPQSREMARYVQKELVKRLRFPDEGIYYNNLALVRPTAMPSILIEAAYIMFPDHERRMVEEKYTEQMAKAVYRGICKYLKQTGRDNR